VEAAYLDFDGVLMHFLVTNEQAEHKASVTEHAVERGANVSDHVRDEADAISLQVIISNAPTQKFGESYGGFVAGKPLQVEKFERSLAPTPGSLMNAGLNALEGLLNPPDAVVAMVLQYPFRFNAVKDEVQQLLDWKESGTIGKVITGWRDYEDMVITGVNVQRTSTTGDAAEVSIDFRKIRLVEVSLVNIPIPAEIRAKKMLNKGKQPTVPLPEGPKKSVAKALAEKFLNR
jgi:hypothetical protein